MTTAHTPDGLIGASVLRVEDPVLLTGKGCYTDDIQLPGMLHMALLRSPHSHAKILSINTSLAQAMPGIEAVLTGADLSEHLNVPVEFASPPPQPRRLQELRQTTIHTPAPTISVTWQQSTRSVPLQRPRNEPQAHRSSHDPLSEAAGAALLGLLWQEREIVDAFGISFSE